jgi:hypothetical protein
MRPKKLGLIAALAVAVLAPGAAWAQKPAAAAPATTVTEAARKAGMAEAPAVVQAASLPCQVADARLLGKNEDKKAKTSVAYYEVACTGNMGFIVEAKSGATPTAFNCMEANTPGPDGKVAAPCILPGNANPRSALGTSLKTAGVDCAPTNARVLGRNKAGQSIFEVACQGGDGYILIAGTPFNATAKAQAMDCLMAQEAGGVKCTLSDASAKLAVVDQYAQQSKTGCVVKDRRYIGVSQSGSTYYEASCQDGKGYMFKVDKGAVTSVNCAQAVNLLGGCKLTDSREAATQQAGLYTRLAQSAGSNCQVDRYALFPAQSTDEVVELVCKDGSSAVGVFKANGKGEVLNCGHALAAGYRCTLGKIDTGYAALTADLQKNNVKTCKVSNARTAAKSAKGTVFVEVACADGLNGYMIEYNVAPKVAAISATGCAFTGGCTLPGNK